MRHYPLILLLWIVVEAHGLDGKDVSRRTKRTSNYRGGRGRSSYDSGSGFPTYGTERWNNIGGGGVPVGDSGVAENNNVIINNNDWDRYSIGSGIWDNTGEDILSGTRRSGDESGRRNNWEDNFAVFGNRRWNNVFGGGAGPAEGGSVANETRQSGNGLRRGNNNWDDYFSAFGGTGRQNPDGEGTRNNSGGATRNNSGGATRNNAGGATRNNAGDATRNTAGLTRNTAGDETRGTGTEERENSGTDESENAEDDESDNAEDDESENAEDDESENAETDGSENDQGVGNENAEPEGSEDDETEESENGGTEESQNAAAEVNQNSAADSNENSETQESQDAEAAEARNDDPQNSEAERRGSYENNNNWGKYFTGFGSREQPTIAQGSGYAEGEGISIGSVQSGDVGGSGISVDNGVASGYGETKIG